MMQLTNAEVIREILTLMRDVVPLLEGKRIDDAIAGIAEARELMASKAEICKIAEDSEKRLQHVAEREAAVLIEENRLDEKADRFAYRESNVAAREEETQKALASVDEALKHISTREAAVAQVEALAAEKLAQANAAHAAAQELQKSYAAKIKKLNEIEGA